MPAQISDASTSTVEPDALRIKINHSLFSPIATRCFETPGAAERRSRDDADHAPVEHPERSGPESLPDILTRPMLIPATTRKIALKLY